MKFNSNNPAISGLEWYPTRRLPKALKLGAGTGLYFASTATETVELIVPWLISPNSALVGVDVYDANAVVAPVVGGLDVPTTSVDSTAGWGKTSDASVTWNPYGGGTGFVDKAINDSMTQQQYAQLIEVTDQTFIRYKPAGIQHEGHLTWQGAGSYVKVTNGTAGNDPSSSRVGWIEIRIVARAHIGRSATLDGICGIGAVNYGSADGPSHVTGNWALYTFHYYWNPATGTQWYNSDIADFLSGGPSRWGLSVRGKAPTECWIGAVNIVWRSLAEQRLATGYIHALADDYAGIGLLNPADGSTASWSKTTGTVYLALFYLTGAGGNAALNGLDQASLAENPGGALGGWTGVEWSTSPYTAVPAARGASPPGWSPSVLLSASGPIESVDSQPYAVPSVMRVAVADALGDDAEKLPAHATDNYAMIRAVIGMFDQNGVPIVPDADLTVQIVDISNTPVGGSATIAVADVPADGRWHLITTRLSSAAALSSGTDYWIAFTTTSTVPWSVAYADIVNSAAVFPFNAGGVVNTVTGTTDLLANAGTVPPALTGFTATVGSFTPSPLPPGGPTTISYAQLGWDASSLGGDFGYYEISRSSDGGTTWFPIAHVTTEANNAYVDLECLRNVAENYRVRVVRADGSPSDWVS